MRFKFIALACLASLLTACAGSVTPPARYMLPTQPIGDTPATAQATLKVRPPRLAHYLDVDGVIMQLDDISLNAARDHLWAEGLNRQLERTLRARLSQSLPTLRVIRDDGSTPGGYTLLVDVDQFQGRYDGVAIASGQWQLRDDTNALVDMEGYRIETPLTEDGYPALVRALDKSWAAAAEQIANQLNQGNFF